MSNIFEIIKMLILRWRIESPKLFVKLQWISGILTSIIATVLTLNETNDWMLDQVEVLSMSLTTILISTLTFLIAVFGTSRITVKDPKELEK